ncbi:hypothetical protein [Fumia xinanensis]|uniref:Uncharacterized protein n=1 Tax=Fumia xinanensis TaxID=2763659 RepID=A0A926I7F5_9FIRM|nr:hypothetical protein [Fumia xinanensis]MBC8559802.1 hypothetical protein [Fumia xinanensis]
MKKSSAALLSIICLLTGIILGFLIAPAKGGIGNNCGNTTHNHYRLPDSDEETQSK